MYAGVFTQTGPITLGPSPRFGISSGKTALVSSSTCQAATFERIPRPLQGRLLDHFGLMLVLSGAMSLDMNGDLDQASPGDLVVLDLSQPLRFNYANKNSVTSEITLWVPRAHGAIGSADPALSHGRIMRSSRAAASVVGAAVRALHQSLDQLGPTELDRLVGGLFELSLASLRTDEVTSPSTGLESLATICRHIEANLAATDLDAGRLAETFGLSRASLYRLFEPVGGVASYVRARRLSRAREELLAAGLDDRRIGPIAYQNGFRSVTAFNRAFREAYGQAPREARRNRLHAPRLTAKESHDIGALAKSLLAIIA